MQKRFWLYLCLVACCLLVWARVRQPVAIAAPVAPTSTHAKVAAGVPMTNSTSMTALPSQLSRNQLEPALRDPFSGVQPVQEPAPPPPRQIIVPPAPSAPLLELVFAGRMTSPDGRETIFVKQGAQTLSLTEGETLPNGYRVRAITQDAVEFDYPALKATAKLELPSVPKQEIR